MSHLSRITALIERAGLPAPTIGMDNEQAWGLIADALEQLPVAANNPEKVSSLIADKGVQAYLNRLNSEKEYLIAAYMAETGLNADEIVIEMRDGIRWYPAPKYKLAQDDVLRWMEAEYALENDLPSMLAGARIALNKLRKRT